MHYKRTDIARNIKMNRKECFSSAKKKKKKPLKNGAENVRNLSENSWFTTCQLRKIEGKKHWKKINIVNSIINFKYFFVDFIPTVNLCCGNE